MMPKKDIVFGNGKLFIDDKFIQEVPSLIISFKNPSIKKSITISCELKELTDKNFLEAFNIKQEKPMACSGTKKKKKKNVKK